jgi:hypothetical protein
MKFDTRSEEFMVRGELFTVKYVSKHKFHNFLRNKYFNRMCFEVNHCQEKQTENPHLRMC